MMLDVNQDPSDGIKIASAVQTFANTWSQVNFNAADLATDTSIINILSDLTSGGGSYALPSAGTAQTHMAQTLLCTRAGAYRGTISGDDTGPFGVIVDAATGYVGGYVYSNLAQSTFPLTGSTAISSDQTGTFATGMISGIGFSGQFDDVDNVSGTWTSSPYSGTFTAERVGGNPSAAYRFTGDYMGTDDGFFVFDISSNNQVTGYAYSVASDELATLSGTVSGSALLAAATFAGGTTDINATIDKTAGTVSGTWTDNATESGSFFGSGCQLN
jgi:hypothetical protein